MFKDVCELPKKLGRCEESIPKWFFSTKNRKCVQRNYTGCGGNGNRFDSKQQCEDTCDEFIAKTPCKYLHV